MITISQIKAARALLDWKQSDLANASGLSMAAIATLEQNKGSPRDSTWQAIRSAFEQAGIEFTDEPGVRVRREKFNMRVLEGHHSLITVWRDQENQLGLTKGEILLSGVDERIFIQKYKPELKYTLERRKELGVRIRHLLEEGDTLLTAPPEFYRAIPSYLFHQTPYFVYGDRVAIINWGPPQTVLLIQNPLIADTFRRQFEFNWSIGKPLNPRKTAIASLQ